MFGGLVETQIEHTAIGIEEVMQGLRRFKAMLSTIISSKIEYSFELDKGVI